MKIITACIILISITQAQEQPTMMQTMTPNVMVNDVNKTVEYYRNVLEFELTMSVPDSGQLDWAAMKSGPVEMMFQSSASLVKDLPEFAQQQPGGTLTLFTQVGNVHELYDKVKGKAIIFQELHTTFYGMDEFTIKDLNGYYLTFATPAKQ